MDSRVSFCFILFSTGVMAEGGCGKHNSLPASFPWQANIYKGHNVVCAGSLIHPSALITQGLCGRSIQESPESVVVVLGNQHHDLSQVPKQYQRRIAVVVLPGQSEEEAETDDLDLALLYLDHPADLEPVCLPKPTKHPGIPNTKAYVLWWEDDVKTSHTLNTMDNTDCLSSADPRLQNYISDNTLCLDNAAGGLTLPLGSAGSGAFYKTGSWTLGGVLTLGGPPAVFARLTPQAINWVRSSLAHRPKRSLSPELMHDIDL